MTIQGIYPRIQEIRHSFRIWLMEPDTGQADKQIVGKLRRGELRRDLPMSKMTKSDTLLRAFNRLSALMPRFGGDRPMSHWLSSSAFEPSLRKFRRVSLGTQRELVRKLEVYASAFTETHLKTDRDFVELSRSLQRLYQTAQSLAGLVKESLSAMRDALGRSRVSGERGVAARSLCDLRAGLSETSEELETLRSLAGQLRHLRITVERIERVGIFVRTSVFGFAIESARTPECQDMFGSFVSELRQLADRITDIAGKIGTQALSAQSAQQLEWQKLSSAHTDLLELAKELEKTAGVTAEAAQALLDDSLSALGQAAECMAQITLHAGNAVYFLQFGDIVRQKTEHIAAALREAATLLADASQTRRKIGRLSFGHILGVEQKNTAKLFRARAATVDRILAIQVAQLETIRNEIQEARCQLGEAFISLSCQTSGLKDALCGRQRSRTDRRMESLEKFKADLCRMGFLRRRGHELRLNARRSVREAVGTSAQLADHVERVKDVNIEVHIQALNAIVKTAALGARPNRTRKKLACASGSTRSAANAPAPGIGLRAASCARKGCA